MISGIQSKPEWNGTFCTIQKYIKNKQRYHILFHNGSFVKKEALLKASNLSIIYDYRYQASEVTICRQCNHQFTNGTGKLEEDMQRLKYGMVDCPHCKSAFCCSQKCMKIYSQIFHSTVCSKFREYALIEHQTITELRDLFKFKVFMLNDDRCEWLESMNLHNNSIWKQLCMCEDIPFGDVNQKYNFHPDPVSFWGFGNKKCT